MFNKWCFIVSLMALTCVTGEAQEVITLVAFTPKTYFYSSPNFDSIRNAYLVSLDEVVPIKEQQGFVYVEYKNNRGQVTRGWLSRIDLIPKEGDYKEGALLTSIVCEEYQGNLGNEIVRLVATNMRNDIYRCYMEKGGKRKGFVGVIDDQTNEFKLVSDDSEIMVAKIDKAEKKLAVKYYSADRRSIQEVSFKCMDDEN